jgi:hypothetical protein
MTTTRLSTATEPNKMTRQVGHQIVQKKNYVTGLRVPQLLS